MMTKENNMRVKNRTEPFTVRLPLDLAEVLKQKAEENKTTVNPMLILYLRKGLSKTNEGEKNE